MKRFVLFFFCALVSAPSIASANQGIANTLASLESTPLTSEDIDDGFDASAADPAEEEEAADLDNILDASAYCEDSSAPAQILQAAAKKKKRSSKRCGCSSGCGMIQAGLKPYIKKFVAAAAQIGIKPLSCIRTQACQDRLRACYERCGQRGRAAKVSKHKDGRACDFSKAHAGALSRLKKKTGLPIKRLSHGKEGGGLHEFQ